MVVSWSIVPSSLVINYCLCKLCSVMSGAHERSEAIRRSVKHPSPTVVESRLRIYVHIWT